MSLTDKEHFYEDGKNCPNPNPIAILDPITIADGCSLVPERTDALFRRYRDNYRDFQHNAFDYQKFHEKFFDTVALTGDPDYFIGRIEINYYEFLGKLKKLLNVESLSDTDEHFEEILLKQIEKLERITDKKVLEEEFPEIYKDYVQGEELRHSFEPVLSFAKPGVHDIEISNAKSRQRYYYNCGLRFIVSKFTQEQAKLYRNMINNRHLVKEYIRKRPLNGFWMKLVDPDKFELYVAATYLANAKNEKFTKEARMEYLNLVSRYFAYVTNKDVAYFDYQKNEKVTFTEVYSEYIALISKQVGWELLPEGSPIRSDDEPKKKEEVPEKGALETPTEETPEVPEEPEEEKVPIDLTDPEVIKELTGAAEVGDSVNMNLYEANKAKVMFYKDSGYIGTAVGVKLNKGYIAFIYPNGVVVMDVISTKETIKDAIGNGIYAVKAEDFIALSSLPKSELRSLKDKREFLYHSGDWETRLRKIITREGSLEEMNAANELVRTLGTTKKGRK